MTEFISSSIIKKHKITNLKENNMQQAIYGESYFDYLVYLPKDYDGIKKISARIVFARRRGKR